MFYQVIASNQSNKSSMAMDLDAKRKSEMDFINGRIVVLADKHGIPAPVLIFIVFSSLRYCLSSWFTRWFKLTVGQSGHGLFSTGS